jgi:hypothetical protein
MPLSNVSGSSRSAELQHDSSLPTEEPVQGQPDAIDFVETPPPLPWTPPWAVPDPVNVGGGTAPPTSVGGGGPAEPAVKPPPVAGPESTPEAGPKREAPPITTGLEKVKGPDKKLAAEVNEILSHSKHLREIWAKAQANGWKLQFVTDRKSEANPGPPPTVSINLKDVKTEGPGRAAAIAALIAHEVGHAGTPFPPLLNGRNENEYVEKNTEQALRHEGAAALANLKAREEIKKETGIDIGVRGAFDEFYDDVYRRMKLGPPEGLTPDQGISMLGQFMGAEPEQEDGTTKREAYEEMYRERYRKLMNPGYFPHLPGNE